MSFNKERLEKRFAEEYEKLDKNQRLAVDTIEGPVMVIAGPGTGKTQILASRIGKILLETDTRPQNILCLTYTEAGVVAMRKRLLQFIGSDAYKVNIYTFHAFCNEVIQDNLHLFEKTSLDLVSELEKIQLLKQLIDSFPKNHPLKRYRGDAYFEIGNMAQLFSTMKREGWSSEFLNGRIDEYIADLPNRDEFVYKTSRLGKWSKGDLKPTYKDALDKMEKLRAAVDEFDHFQQLMHQKKRYDFDDMINWVIQAFDENASLLSDYQEKFQYILVDEYQDTSGTQNYLVKQLISYWDRPNVFVVGDDDQSIYRFQGANVENMNQFLRSYLGLLVIVLEKNYRSNQLILDVSMAVIQQNRERLIHTNPELKLTKNLVSSKIYLENKSNPPAILEYETQREEMIGIATHVQQLLNEGVTPGRIGVIYRENRYGEELSQYFQPLKIPVYSRRTLNIFEIPLAKKIILILKYLAAEQDRPFGGDEMLFELLHFDWFHVAPIEIARLSLEVAPTKFSDHPSFLRKRIQEKSQAIPVDLFTPAIDERLRKAGATIEKLIADTSNLTLQNLVETIIREAGVLNQIMQSHDKVWQLQVLTGFFDFVKDETARNPMLSLRELVKIIDLMEKEDLPLPLVKVSGSDKGVNLMTVHGSKGLEFEYVFFAGCNSTYWEKKRKPWSGYSFPDTIFTSQPGHEDEEEMRRLFYVALTRAEEQLFISYSKFKNDGRELEPSMFIAEIEDQQPTYHPQPVVVNDELLASFSAMQFSTSAPEIEKLEEDFISRLLDRFVMNATALNNYLRCPLEFYFKNLLRIPSPKNEAMEFGSAIHTALEKLFRKMQDGGTETFPSKDEFIVDFEWYMSKHRESFTQQQFDRRIEYGRETLSNYYDRYIDSFNRIVAIERNIQNVVVNGVPLKGKLDKLEFDGRSANVVDYKTGDPEKAYRRLNSPSEKDPNGGDYWRQAVFYKILVDNYDSRKWNVVSTEFDFIEPDKRKNYRKEKVVITPADITTVTQQITDTWRKIQNREFYIGCGKKECHWCNFIKSNKLEVALHETVEDLVEE